MSLVAGVVVGLIAINLWTFLAFGHDKQRAIRGGRRVAEANLLALALIGGSPAALFARQHFRHKTRKQPFTTWLMAIAAGQVAAIGAAFLL